MYPRLLLPLFHPDRTSIQIRLEAHAAASTLPFAAAAQRARLAALNALAVAPVPYDYAHRASAPVSSSATTATDADDDRAVASICPPVEERRLDSVGRPVGVRTAAVLGREAVAAAAAIVVAEDAVAANAAAAVEEEDWAAAAGERKTGGFAGGYLGSGAIVAAAGAAGTDVSVTVVTRAGVGGVLKALRSAGRFEEAADVALRGLDQVGTCGGGGRCCWWGTFRLVFSRVCVRWCPESMVVVFVVTFLFLFRESRT